MKLPLKTTGLTMKIMKDWKSEQLQFQKEARDSVEKHAAVLKGVQISVKW
jgi:hypothetical protein